MVDAGVMVLAEVDDDVALRLGERLRERVLR